MRILVNGMEGNNGAYFNEAYSGNVMLSNDWEGDFICSPECLTPSRVKTVIDTFDGSMVWYCDANCNDINDSYEKTWRPATASEVCYYVFGSTGYSLTSPMFPQNGPVTADEKLVMVTGGPVTLTGLDENFSLPCGVWAMDIPAIIATSEITECSTISVEIELLTGQKVFCSCIYDLYTVICDSCPTSGLYFPHVDTTYPWQTEIAVINTSPIQTVPGTFMAYSNDGQIVSFQPIMDLYPHGRREINVADVFRNHADIGYIVFETDSDTVQGYTKFYQEGVCRTAIPAVKEINASSDIYIPHIDSSEDWWTGVSMVNTTAIGKEVVITFNDGRGVTRWIGGNEHIAFTIADLFGGQPQRDIESAVITNASGIIGLELFGSKVAGSNQLDGFLLTGDTSRTIYYPHVDCNGWWTGIVAYNPLDAEAQITVKPYSADGNALYSPTLSLWFSLWGKEKYVDVVSRLGLPAQTEWFNIDSTLPLTGFELFGTEDGQQLAAYAGSKAKTGVFAKLEKNGWTGIAFVNTEESPAAVALTAYNDGGNTVATKTVSVGGHAKMVDIAETIFAPQNITSATYLSYSSDKTLVGFQLNGSSDNTMLDALPALAATDIEAAGDTFTNSLGMTFKRIPAGTFSMGSLIWETDGLETDEDRHDVMLTKYFYMQTTEVTQGQWQSVMGSNPSYFKDCGANCPVEHVSWDDIQVFIAAVNSLGEGIYRLPTEAEWEYACRAGSTTAFANGSISDEDRYYCGYDPILDIIGWYCDNSNNTTHPVREKLSNAWGLYDMHGNVREWCSDLGGAYPRPVVVPVDPTGPSIGSSRVNRGGSWDSTPYFCRSAVRYSSSPEERGGNLGFRLVAQEPIGCTDWDGDGYYIQSGCGTVVDCNDADSAVHPGATEVCGNSIDNDCDGQVDEGCVVGDTFTNTPGMTFKRIPAGTFIMGSPASELGRYDNETQHQVTLTQSFYMQTTEVTQSQWQSVMGSNPSYFKGCGANCPVEKVSWNDIQGFITVINSLGEGTYRLPTEAEWEYACRAGSTTAIANGPITVTACQYDYNLNRIAWNCSAGVSYAGCYDVYNGSSCSGTHPVAEKMANDWGLYDMHGNVSEWCSDWYDDYPTIEVVDPTGPSTGTKRVDRGGSWYNGASECRSALRVKQFPDYRSMQIGFRLVALPNQ